MQLKGGDFNARTARQRRNERLVGALRFDIGRTLVAKFSHVFQTRTLMMSRPLRPLLPVERHNPQTELPPLVPPTRLRHKRKAIAVACQACRKRKARCDGAKPTCNTCCRRGTECSYTVLDTNVMLVRDAAKLKIENHELRNLIRLLSALSEPEAHDIFMRLRTTDDPIAVLRFVKDAKLLLVNPPVNAHPTASNPRLQAIDLLALEDSHFKMHARPWTVVAGDGIVSALISSFFTWEDTFFYPFIDQPAFLDDMRNGSPETAKYCSPFLVNAICATRCVRESGFLLAAPHTSAHSSA